MAQDDDTQDGTERPHNYPPERVAMAEDLLSRGTAPGRVVDALVTQFNCSPRMANYYMAEVRRRWREISDEERASRKDHLRSIYHRCIEESIGTPQASAAVAAARALAQLDGLNAEAAAPEVSVKIVLPGPMTPEQYEAELDDAGAGDSGE